MKIVFMGTPDFAVASLEAIVNSDHEIVGVITAPDKPAGRGKKIRSSSIKEYAISKDLPILQPINLKDENFISELKRLNAELFVVVAFRMLPEIVWRMAPKGTINLHASLLPYYRGAAPINWAIINGEQFSGVTTFYIEKEIDTGKILLQEKVNIDPEDNAGILHDTLMKKGAALLLRTINDIKNDLDQPVSQKISSEQLKKIAPKINKKTCKINWDKPNNIVYNHIRGLSPYPGAWTRIMIDNNELQLKIFSSALSNIILKPGEIKGNNKELHIGCLQGSLKLAEVQLEGKKRMDAVQFIIGARITNSFCL